ncbi:MAG: mannose-1-phosphate guanylyltransferase/mannose-6-phosphate isomerase [Thermodesulfovibrionaceae bacterium]
MKFIVLAGGSGTRLWPYSRKNFPKQFLKFSFIDNYSFFQKTIKRLSRFANLEFLIVTNENYKFYIIEQLKEVFDRKIKYHFILEPTSRNTAPAIALALKYALERLNESDIFFVFPSDHLVEQEKEFLKYINLAKDIANKGYIVTFGIKPTKPEIGYGYIKIKNQQSTLFYPVEKFVEKPNYQEAKEYISQNCYFWNSGIFAFKADTVVEEFKKYIPDIGEIFNKSYEEVLNSFQDLPEISFDYAIMEKTDKAVVVPLPIFWSDIGSWESLYEVLRKDKNKNVIIGKTEQIETKRSFILGGKRLIATVGVKDLIVVDTEDALLIAKKGESQKVKEIVKNLLEKSASETLEHTTSYRPWGYFTVLEKGVRYKIKRITVNPGARLSLQMHHHRSEHWIVVKGTAKVKIADKEVFVHENESIYVPKSTLHRLENPGKIPLEIIEVQVGEYIEEDDIKRFDDDYRR